MTHPLDNLGLVFAVIGCAMAMHIDNEIDAMMAYLVARQGPVTRADFERALASWESYLPDLDDGSACSTRRPRLDDLS